MTDITTIMIRVVGLIVRCFYFLREFVGYLYFFLKCSHRIGLIASREDFKKRLQLVIDGKICILGFSDVVYSVVGDIPVDSKASV